MSPRQLLEKQGKSATGRSWIVNPEYRWPKGVVPYKFKESFCKFVSCPRPLIYLYLMSFSTAKADRKKIKTALAELETKSGGCVSFKERTDEVSCTTYIELEMPQN